MKTMKKRVMSGVLSGALALSLAVPAFAADNTSNKETEITGTYKDVPIAVVVPAKGEVFINPYGVDIKVKEDANDSANSNEATISGQQIVTAPMAVKNQSAMNLGVSATVTGAIKEGSDMRLSDTTTKSTTDPITTKSAYVYFQMKSSTLAGDASTVTSAAIATEYAAWGAPTFTAGKDIVVSSRGGSQENILTLKAAKQTSAGAFDEYNAGSIALYRLTGDCVASPRGAGWATTDGFTANVAFTFSPVELEKYTVTVGTPTATGGANGTVTADVAQAAEGDIVTFTFTADNNGDIATIQPQDADGNNLGSSFDITGTASTAVTATYTMPAQAVSFVVTIHT